MKIVNLSFYFFLLLIITSSTCTPLVAQTGPNWASGLFFQQGANNDVRGQCVYNGELYAVGNFTAIGGTQANRIAKWNGSAWRSLGSGLNNQADAVCAYKGEIYAGGYFTSAGGVAVNHIARWNGNSWQSVGTGVGNVTSMCVYNGELYVGGYFTTAGGVAAKNIARWNGSTWQSLGTGVNNYVYSLCVYNNELYVGGSFQTAGGITVNGIAKWNGSTWQAVGSGLKSSSHVDALCVYHGHLYAGGYMCSISEPYYCYMAKFDGTSWQHMTGISTIHCLSVHNDELYIGGNFGNVSRSIAKWNGTTIQSVGYGMDDATGNYADVYSLCSYNGRLYAGGSFNKADHLTVENIACWNGSSWQRLLKGMDRGISCFCEHNGDLYAAGSFMTTGGLEVNRVAKWNGSTWQALGNGLNDQVRCICFYNDELYAGGYFSGHVAKWNGSAWQSVGSGINHWVYGLCVYKGELYATGTFNHVVKWNGTSWVSVGSMNDYATCLAVHNDELYVGGYFTSIGGQSADQLAKWNGTSWQKLNTPIIFGEGVWALCSYNGELYAGGGFSTIGNASASYIARWNGSEWRSLGSGVTKGTDYCVVSALCEHNDELYVGGDFRTAGGITTNGIAKWDGTSWQSLSTGMNDNVFALCSYDDHRGSGSALYAGGAFTTAGGNFSAYVARWGTEDSAVGIESAKEAADGRLVSVTDISTAVFGDIFYLSHIVNGQQLSGIRVDMSDNNVIQDRFVAVTGRTATNEDGERYINAISASTSGPASAKSLFMTLKTLGGGPASGGYQAGVAGGYGLNNIGFLVRVCGKVTYIDEHNFMMDDGSNTPVHCVTPPSVIVDPLWRFVAVTGISSCEKAGGNLLRKILVRSDNDWNLHVEY